MLTLKQWDFQINGNKNLYGVNNKNEICHQITVINLIFVYSLFSIKTSFIHKTEFLLIKSYVLWHFVD